MSDNNQQLIGHGLQFEISVASTFTPVNGVLSVDFGSDKVDALDTTDMLTAGTTRTYTPGLENPGDVSVKLNLLPGDATQQDLRAAKGVLCAFKSVTASTISTRTFQGIITSIDEAFPDDKLCTMTVKIQISGPVTLS